MDMIIPASYKACTYCYNRKVKCDGALPRCGKCKDGRHDCDITARVFYSYQDVKSLVDRIQDLEARLEASSSRSEPGVEFDDAHRFDVNVQLQQSGLAWENEQQNIQSIDQVSQELGALSLGCADIMAQYYVGNATGTRFAKIFLSSLDLPVNLSTSSSVLPASPRLLVHELGQSCASLPPKQVADYAMSTYVKRAHVWWPVMTYPALRSIYGSVYARKGTCSSFQRFVVFITLAIGSKEAQDIGCGAQLNSAFAPEEYYRTALHLFGPFSGLEKITALILLSLWSAHSPLASDHINLWQMVRHTISLAIEMGLHRKGSTWGYSPSELEARNRCWWCIYGLERAVAVGLGRTLSIRNQAIDAAFPQHTTEDDILPGSDLTDSSLRAFGIRPAVHLIKLRAISGDILESVYIARPTTSLSPAILQRLVNSLRQRLSQWRGLLEEYALSQGSVYLHMKVKYALVVIMLNRPSPSFPAPDQEMVNSCHEAAKSAICTWALLQERQEIFSDWKTLHDVIMTGLAWLYTCWKLPDRDLTVTSAVASTCQSIMACIQGDSTPKTRYSDLFDSLLEQVLASKRHNSSETLISSATDATDHGMDIDWMNTNFEQSVLDASCAFDLASFDDLMLDYPYLIDPSDNVGW